MNRLRFPFPHLVSPPRRPVLSLAPHRPLSSAVFPGGEDATVGFRRPDFHQESLAGTVRPYNRHVFLRYGSPATWPPNVEVAEPGSLPVLLATAIKARKGSMRKTTRLTICGGDDDTDLANGDALVFPDMIRRRHLAPRDVDSFVEEVLLKDTVCLQGAVERLVGSYIFVCAHATRDQRCGFCGPVLIKKFQEEINARNLQGEVFVSPCSHTGGHKYAGNVIIFSANANGEVTGHWYGYVMPDDITVLMEQHIGEGRIVDRIWRGQMGLSEKPKELLRN